MHLELIGPLTRRASRHAGAPSAEDRGSAERFNEDKFITFFWIITFLAIWFRYILTRFEFYIKKKIFRLFHVVVVVKFTREAEGGGGGQSPQVILEGGLSPKISFKKEEIFI